MKILASDYDGTFFTDEMQVKRNVDAVNQWRKAGNLFGFVTGRSIDMIKQPIKQYQIPIDFIVCNNGTTIYNKNKELLTASYLETEHMQTLLQYFEKSGAIHYVFNTKKGTFACALKEGSWINSDLTEKNLDITPIEKSTASEMTDIFQICIAYKTSEDAKACSDYINQNFGEEMHAHLNIDSVDITPPKVDKGIGLHNLLKLQGMKKEQLLTIGDGENDISMLTRYRGYTVDNACSVVKQAATKIYPNVETLIQNQMK